MRRLLLAAAAAAPLAVVAAIATAPPGKVVDLGNYNATASTPTSYINKAQCAGTTPLDLEWNVVTSFTGTGSYKIFASDVAPDTTGTNANYCAEDDSTDPVIHAGQIGNPIVRTTNIQGADVSGATVAAEASADCTRDGDVVYVCAHLVDGSTRHGSAVGLFEVQVTAPERPTGVNAGPAGEDSVYVTWTAPTTGVEVDYYVAVATPVGGTQTFRSGRVEGSPAEIGGLTEGTSYSVVVYAYSLGGNESLPSDPPALASPAPVYDFWEWYKLINEGQDSGGCAAGGAGPLALLAVGALLLLRRRS